MRVCRIQESLPRPLLTVLLTLTLSACASADVAETRDSSMVPDQVAQDLAPKSDGGLDGAQADGAQEQDHGAQDLATDSSLADQLPADVLPTPDTTTAATWSQVANFGANPGNLDMFLYTPKGLPQNAPLIVVLHPCQITAKSFAANAGWNRLADLRKAVMVYPEQSYANNLTICFNWFDDDDTDRGSGEAASIVAMVNKAKTLHSVDPKRVFVAGLSAGGAMTAALLASYPDVFAGGAVFAGVPAGCATSMFSSTTCMMAVDKTPATWAAKVKAAHPSHSGPYPKLSVFHGSSDIVVYPANREELVEQWTAVHGADAVADTSQTVGDVTRELFKTAAGVPVVYSYRISGMPHGVPVDPGTAAHQGGSAGFGYYDVDLWGAWRAAEDWGI